MSPRSAEVTIDLSVTTTSAPTITSLSPTSGIVGTAVTIAGTNFGASQGTSTVRFNGTVATVTSWSASAIVAKVPSGATTGMVTVTVGGVASNGVSFTVTVSDRNRTTLGDFDGDGKSDVAVYRADPEIEHQLLGEPHH